jgi:phospholipid/cholesterol/gamma-HCH transport system permease protein
LSKKKLQKLVPQLPTAAQVGGVAKDAAKEMAGAAVGSVTMVVGPVFGAIGAFGEHMTMLGKAIYWAFRRPFRAKLFIEQMEFIGIGSLPIIILVGGFTGAVTALQAVTAFALLQSQAFAGMAVGLSLAVELAPVLTALMLAGRAGAGIATELGTMRITEQIDALETMAVSPIQYLIVPRLMAGLIMGPLLTMTFFLIGMAGAYLVAVVVMGVDHGSFLEKFVWYVDPVHIAQGLIKSVVFGLGVCLIGCYQGYNAQGGGRGVGIATTRAVVMGSVMVLCTDYFLTSVLIDILGMGKQQ